MSVWLLPAIVVWLVAIGVLLIKLWPGLVDSMRDRAYRIGLWMEALVSDIAWPKKDRKYVGAVRFLTAIGGFFLTIFLSGVIPALLGVNGLATVMLMFFPGTIIAGWVYRRLLKL